VSGQEVRSVIEAYGTPLQPNQLEHQVLAMRAILPNKNKILSISVGFASSVIAIACVLLLWDDIRMQYHVCRIKVDHDGKYLIRLMSSPEFLDENDDEGSAMRRAIREFMSSDEGLRATQQA
jgi:hypothetical protein